MARVLVVDGDPSSRISLRRVLERAGHVVADHGRGHEALVAARAVKPDVVLAEITLPDMNPFELVKELKRESTTANVRVIVVSDRDAEVDRVVAFELGTDDYVTKPYSERELVLRLGAVLRRSDIAPPQRVGRLTIDRAAARVFVDGEEIAMTKLERDLLLDLVDAGGRVRTREDLIRDVLRAESVDVRAVDSHVKRLRAKLGEGASLIETVKGVGYRLASESDD